MRKAISVIIAILFFWLLIEVCLPIGAFAETVYVLPRELNGRTEPSTKSFVEACFCKDEELECIELNVNGWARVIGGESGTVWCKAEYLSASPVVRKWKNISGGSVNLRAQPSCDAKRVGKIKSGRVMRVSAEVMGWGYIKDQGWIDLDYFELVETNE